MPETGRAFGDLRAMTGSYRGSGEASYHPKLLLGIIIYGNATGVFSAPNRRISRALSLTEAIMPPIRRDDDEAYPP
jgi:hypothetical protein